MTAPQTSGLPHIVVQPVESVQDLEAIPRTVGTSTPGVGPQVDQADLDSWIAEYNEARPHQGRWCLRGNPDADLPGCDADSEGENDRSLTTSDTKARPLNQAPAVRSSFS
jgi:hypothetical protein